MKKTKKRIKALEHQISGLTFAFAALVRAEARRIAREQEAKPAKTPKPEAPHEAT